MKHTELIERLRAGSGGMKHWQELESEAADAIESLQAENTALLKANLDCVDHFNQLKEDYDALKLDAERYRFLISDASDKNCVSPEQSLLVDEVWQRVLDCGNNYTKSDVDYAIDAAMKGAA